MTTSLLDIRWTDIVDILVVAVVLGITITWLRHARARLALVGLLILGGIYLTARQLDLQLTVWVFSGFFAAFVIVIVVVFQEDLRGIFEQIALFGLRKKPRLPSRGIVDIVTRAVVHLAERKYGALLVLPGRDPLDRHVTGGIPLGGSLSEPLLLSLFDKNTPGHDGAAIIVGDSVERFAVHLPLSADHHQLSGVGTRHAAALGLAERSDALCILVSEERGTVSVASKGKLRALSQASSVADEMVRFLEASTEPPATHRLPLLRALRSWREMATGLVLALGLWVLLVAGRTVVEKTVTVPVHVDRPPAGVSLTIDPSSVQVSISARRGDLLFTPRDALRAVLDGRALEEGGSRTYTLSPENIESPDGVNVLKIEPDEIRLTVTTRP